MSLGYLTVMDNYFKPGQAIPYLEKAQKKNSKSFTIAIILALTKAQYETDQKDADWCKVWKITEAVFENKNLDQDMREKAKKIILEYMSIYKDDCKK